LIIKKGALTSPFFCGIKEAFMEAGKTESWEDKPEGPDGFVYRISTFHTSAFAKEQTAHNLHQNYETHPRLFALPKRYFYF